MAISTITQGWRELDEQIRSWWEGDLHTAQEQELLKDESRTLLFLPFPYSSAGGSEKSFPEMYAWDTHFINLGLMAHGRFDIVRQHIINYLFLIERYGFMPNGNRTYYLTRSQTPVFPESIWVYYNATRDRDLLHQAYPLLKRQYTEYWTANHHRTPIDLATNYDLGEPVTSTPSHHAILMAVAETGLDFTPIFGEDIHQCVPLITNCALVQYARTLAAIAQELGEVSESVAWLQEAEWRSQLIRDYCWNEEQGFFFEYNFVEKRQLPFWSVCAYWTLWARVATPEQAERLRQNLARLEQPYGLSVTDQIYPNPFAEFKWLQWGYPAGWAPIHMIAVAGLDAYGLADEAQRIATKFVTMMVNLYQHTGNLYEKYNVVAGNTDLPIERNGTPPFHGWSSAAAVVLGRRAFEGM